MMRTITSAVAFSVYVSLLVWMSVLATQTDRARYGMCARIFDLHNPLLNEEDAGGGLHKTLARHALRAGQDLVVDCALITPPSRHHSPFLPLCDRPPSCLPGCGSQ